MRAMVRRTKKWNLRSVHKTLRVLKVTKMLDDKSVKSLYNICKNFIDVKISMYRRCNAVQRNFKGLLQQGNIIWQCTLIIKNFSFLISFLKMGRVVWTKLHSFQFTDNVFSKANQQIYSYKEATFQTSALCFPYGDDQTFQPRVD